MSENQQWPAQTEPARSLTRRMAETATERVAWFQTFLAAPAGTRRSEVAMMHLMSGIYAGGIAVIIADLARDAPNIANAYAERLNEHLDHSDSMLDLVWELGESAGADLTATHTRAAASAAAHFAETREA